MDRVDEGRADLSDPRDRVGVYVHLPFCVVRCTYCDFYSLAGQDALAPAYTRALLREIGEFPGRAGYRPPVATIYVGGGTPTHMRSGTVPAILEAIARTFPLDGDAEITVEANPESAGADILRELRGAGANRLSIGVQSFQPALLAMMGRPHGPDAPLKAVGAARGAGFDNVSADLIYGVPGQDEGLWEEELERAAALGTDHLSVYLLETDKETPLARLVNGGSLEEPDAVTIGALYRATESRLAAEGFARYEVSNWARPGRASRHNLGYWNDRPYVGFGASAHSYYLGLRRACRLSAAAYASAVERGEETREALDDGASGTRLSEAIVTALRLAAGADFDELGSRYGVDLWARHGADIERLVARGWAALDPPRVRLTIEGILWSLDALAPFAPDPPAASRRPARAGGWTSPEGQERSGPAPPGRSAR